AAALVVHEVVGALAAREPCSVHGDDLAAGHHADQRTAATIGELVGTLASVDAEELERVELALGARGGHDAGEPAAAPVATHPLEPALEPPELAALQAERDVAECRAPGRGLELDEDPIERLEILRGPGRVEWRVAV